MRLVILILTHRLFTLDCQGVDMITFSNIVDFSNCKIINGHITISNASFIGMHPSNLELLSNVTSITGYLNIDAWHEDFRTLSFLRNLKTIGTTLTDIRYTTLIIENTSLESLGLRSLVQISGRNGAAITGNKALCYAKSIDWSKLVMIINLKNNRDGSSCVNDGFVCDETCDGDGCWGAGPNQCRRCKANEMGNICLLSCANILCDKFCKYGCSGTCPRNCNCSGIVKNNCLDCENYQLLQYCHSSCRTEKYFSNGHCKPCHPECEGGCSGPNADNCMMCKHLKDDHNCVKNCPTNKYLENDICTPCHSQCDSGCTGPAQDDCKNLKKHNTSCKPLEYLSNGKCENCNKECRQGCGGPSATQCYACKSVKDIQTCISKCPKDKYSDNGVCKTCNHECENGCSGPEANNCSSCKNAKDGETCISKCPENKYSNNGVCEDCNDQCKNGCSGPGANNCSSCKKVKDGETCISKCSENKYSDYGVCKGCNNQCKNGCSGPGANECSSCKNVRDGQNCVIGCPANTYQLDGKCLQCDEECHNGCISQGNKACLTCEHVKDEGHCRLSCPLNKYDANGVCIPCSEFCIGGCNGSKPIYGDQGCYNCDKVIVIGDVIKCLHARDACPTGYIDNVIIPPHDEKLRDLIGKTLCVLQESASISIIVGITITVAVVITLSLGIWYLYCRGILSVYKNTVQAKTDPLASSSDDEYKVPRSQLKLIKESEICKIGELGKGAFGIVHEANWTPQGSSDKILVAVKVLHADPSKRSTPEFLQEAVIMASMNHPNVIHLTALCITTEIMLITNLMSLGCLLNYVRENKYNILPKTLLTWSEQIAKGMAYLEGKGLVHRDLAARNVLLETVDCIKITDFGLSRFVGCNELGGSDTKLPVKWLALECLDQGSFTHKSDVWAYGITVWELLTFGKTPFHQIQGRELSKHLRLGTRLPQPTTCNADLYAVLISCWLQQPDLRPDFAELATVFKEMSYDSYKHIGRYGETHAQNLNDIPASTEIPRSLAYSKNDTRTMKSKIATNSSNELNAGNNSHQKKSRELQKLLSMNSTSKNDSLYYLEPNNQITENDSCYDVVTNVDLIIK